MTQVYDARSVTTVVNSITLVGFVDGDMVTTSKDNPNSEVMSDAQGASSIAINNDNIGTITVNLAQTSPCYTKMVQLANNKTIFPAYVISGKEKIGGPECFIEKLPDTNFGKSVGSRAFVIKVLKYSHNIS